MGTVDITSNSDPEVSTSLNQGSVTLASGAIDTTTTLTVTCGSHAGTFMANVTGTGSQAQAYMKTAIGTSGSITHTAQIEVTCSAPSQQQYTVKAGDTLYKIGQEFNISWQTIASTNNISPPYCIYVGEIVTIPSGSTPPPTTTYTVQSEDYLYAIGQKFGISWQSIASSNGITSPYVIYVGQQLVIPPVSPPPSTTYTVKQGDYLYAIAQEFNVPWQQIASANNILAPYLIYAGEQLVIS